VGEITELRWFRSELDVPEPGTRERVRTRTERLIAAGQPRRRALRARRRLIALAAVAVVGVIAAAALAGAAGGLLELVGVAQQPSATVPTLHGASAHYLLGDQLFAGSGPPQQLREPSTGESAWPDAVPSPDGTTLLYEAANRGGQPGRALRLHNLATGADQEVAADAFAPAWRANGMIAYGKTAQRRSTGGDVGAVFPARVQVRATPSGAASNWITTPGTYVPVAWARSRLLVEELAADGAGASLLALDGPGESERLASGWLVALSPDGRVALVSAGALDGQGGPVIRLVDTVTGAIRAALDLRQASIDGLSWRALAATGPGDWAGTHIVLPAAGGMLVLFARADTLEIAKVARFTGDNGIRGAEYQEARMLNAAGSQVIVKAAVLPSSGSGGQSLQSALVCDLHQNRCTRGSDAGTPAHWLSLIANPSRPLPIAAH
jgi:hypothetical protein